MYQLKNSLLVIMLATTAPFLASDDQMMLVDAGLLSQGQGALEQWVESALQQGHALIEKAKTVFTSLNPVPELPAAPVIETTQVPTTTALPNVLTQEMPTPATPVSAQCAAYVTKLSDKFLTYGLGTDTVLAKNKTYYIANMTKVFAAACITYGLYKATRYAYNHYRKKDR